MRNQKPHTLSGVEKQIKQPHNRNTIIHYIYIYIYIFLRSLNVPKKCNHSPKGTFNTLHVPIPIPHVLQRQSVKGQPFGSLAQVSICRHLLVVLPCHTCIFSVGIDDLRHGGRKAGMQHGLKDQRTTKPKPYKKTTLQFLFRFAGMISEITPPPPKKKNTTSCPWTIQ